MKHFASRPGYRPSFRSKWYLSLIGAVMCLLLMFQMDPLYAVVAIVVMVLIYRGIRALRGGHDDLAAIFTSVMTQATRRSQIMLQQRASARQGSEEWRPSIIMINGRTPAKGVPRAIYLATQRQNFFLKLECFVGASGSPGGPQPKSNGGHKSHPR